ncbi:protein STRUBBELIG-RECEPTOR FAMILY 3-like isoform X1 [Iris pallida]|uniref:Protein STRUBBELIG-RECEPTOR FAMILY 3-like isoform X1 n=1 Tax=Iris pallida TaxID=29817 RepID=A0AAX6DYW2_IRIPA|nr:protein STRUBBELIG-RECEPTOR FAMILY 3-like isoform X1 [Iris pallida]
MRATAFVGIITISLMLLSAAPQFSQGLTEPQDVSAINSLYGALGSPSLPGWIPNGGDPCLEAWQGVQCVQSNINAITINAANLGGQLGDGLGNFTSIVTIDLSNNNIGGSIPENLPLTLRTFFLAANQFTGSIPSTLSQLIFLSDMSLNENHLSGDLPDVFQSLSGLINLDLSANNFSGQLPPSMEGLSSLTTLRLQNNQLSGILDVLQDLPLRDLNVENNLFSGPVPEKLLGIQNFKKDGNPFNTSISPSSPSVMPSAAPPSLPTSKAPSPESKPSDIADGTSAQSSPKGKKSSSSTIKVVGYVLVAVVSVIIIVLVIIFCVSKYQERKSRREEIAKWQPVMERERPKESRNNEHLIRPNHKIKKVQNDSEEQKSQHKIDMRGTARTAPMEVPAKQDNGLEMTEEFLLPPPPPPVEKVIVNPIVPPETTRTSPPVNVNTPTSATSYSIASLQQYTNSFGEENLIKDGRLGKLYLAELPDGKLLTVMKLDNANSKISVDDFLELVASLLELRHPNIVELVGYCAEFGQRLLVYNYFSKLTLHDILHYEEDLRGKLSWDARLQIVLGAAKALEYLHEFCQPPIVHQDFEPTNILLNDQLAVRVSECGLGPLLSSNSVTQLSGRVRALFSYEAPEFNESGLYTEHSDVYSFGVVMLELLTGRKPYDSSRPRAEQHLVRWASSQLHDISNLSKWWILLFMGSVPINHYHNLLTSLVAVFSKGQNSGLPCQRLSKTSPE